MGGGGLLAHLVADLENVQKLKTEGGIASLWSSSRCYTESKVA